MNRACFTNDLIAEFTVPSRPSRRVVILCDGLPSVPAKRAIMEFWTKKGFWVIHPRYRGTWESGGAFLRQSPAKDITDIIDELCRKKRIKDLWKDTMHRIDPDIIVVCGVSFGGTAALLTSTHPRVTKVLALAPVVDWRVRGKIEPLEWLDKKIRVAFRHAYRYRQSDWQRLARGTFFNPAAAADTCRGEKIFIIQAMNDPIIPVQTVKKFAGKTGSLLWLPPRGGHLSMTDIIRPMTFRRVKKFLAS